MSLAALLNEQPGQKVSHELGFKTHSTERILPWVPDWKRWQAMMAWLSKKRATGDVSHFWLSYLPKMLATIPHLRVICLEREAEETVRSLVESSGSKNQYSEELAPGEFRTKRAECFPKYRLPKVDAVRAYWTEYYERAAELERRHPLRFCVMPTAALNTKAGQAAILDFVGIETHVYRVGLRLNATPKEIAA